MRDPALVLLRVPVELEWADGAEGGEDSVEDEDVDVVPKIDPDGHEDGEVGEDDGGREVIEGFGCLLESKLDSRLGEQRRKEST